MIEGLCLKQFHRSTPLFSGFVGFLHGMAEVQLAGVVADELGIPQILHQILPLPVVEQKQHVLGRKIQCQLETLLLFRERVAFDGG